MRVHDIDLNQIISQLENPSVNGIYLADFFSDSYYYLSGGARDLSS